MELKEVKQRSSVVIVCLREASPKAWSGYEEGQMGVRGDWGDMIQVRDEEVLGPGGDWGQGDRGTAHGDWTNLALWAAWKAGLKLILQLEVE